MSVTEALLIEIVTVIQLIIFIMNLLNSFELNDKIPKVIKMDNKVCIDLINNWLVSEKTRYIGTKKNYLRKLKKQSHRIQVMSR